MKVFARVDRDGKVVIPDNIRRETGLQPGQLVEVKVLAKKSIMISARNSAR
jgi:AbrB family looped-hinge helix DNA binding protein